MGDDLAKESRAISVTIGQYPQVKKKIKHFQNVITNAYVRYIKCGRQAVIPRKVFLRQMIALEVLYRNNSLRFDLRSSVMAPEVSKRQ